jgi:predicted secreted protein
VKLTSALAIYFLLWVMSAFMLLPFGVRTHDDVGAETVPGQITSAPVNFNPKRLALRATVTSAILFALYYINYVQGWLTLDDIDVSKYLR